MSGFGSRDHSIFRISILLVVCVLAAVEPGSAGSCIQGGPQATYQFVGQCTDCSGTGIGLLTVQNYTLGTALSSCNFVSFTYTSNLTSFTMTPSDSPNLSGMLPVSLPATATVSIRDFVIQTQFGSDVSGSWSVGTFLPVDTGTSSLWGYPPSTAPTLSTAALCALGLLLAGAGALLAQRARRTAKA
jgi:hypothetical protein